MFDRHYNLKVCEMRKEQKFQQMFVQASPSMELTAVTAAWAGPCSTAGTGTEEGAELGAGQGATWHEDRRLTHRDISSTSEVGQIT